MEKQKKRQKFIAVRRMSTDQNGKQKMATRLAEHVKDDIYRFVDTGERIEINNEQQRN